MTWSLEELESLTDGGIFQGAGYAAYSQYFTQEEIITEKGLLVKHSCLSCGSARETLIEFSELVVLATNTPGMPKKTPTGWHAIPFTEDYYAPGCKHCTDWGNASLRVSLPTALVREYIRTGTWLKLVDTFGSPLQKLAILKQDLTIEVMGLLLRPLPSWRETLKKVWNGRKR